MPHFKDTLNRLYFLSEEDIANGGEDLLPSGCVQITDAEAEALRQPTAPMPEVVDQPPQLTPMQIAVLADFFKTNPAIAQALGL